MFTCPNCNTDWTFKPVENMETETNRDTRNSIDLAMKISDTLGSDNKNVTIQDHTEKVSVQPRGYLGKQVFREISQKLQRFNPNYISEGRNSRWEIRK
jgi:hypothetical protein